jgi:DNA-binding response OmpR family regulator
MMTDQPTRLLLVDDEASIREPLGEYLEGQGFVVDLAGSAAEARAKLGEGDYHLVVSDIMMPGEDGLSLTRWLRESVGLPVILLTARSEETERVIGLEIGADDYIAKPFGPRELVARIRAVLRRAGPEGRLVSADEGELYRFGDWVLATETRDLRHADGHEAALSTGEYQLLLAFLRNPRVVLNRDRLLDLVRGREADVFDRSIDNLVSRLRRKIEDDPREPRFIKTIWGGGYSFSADVRRTAGA